MNKKIVSDCEKLLVAYKDGSLGQTVMPEESSPAFSAHEEELRYVYFSLPMSLNYQRNSYKLWESALKTYNDPETKVVFDIETAYKIEENKLREYLLKYGLALQPNKHTDNWKRISETVYKNWGSFGGLLEASSSDFLKLRQVVQVEHKKGFPYLSGSKIFNYWSFILNGYCEAGLDNSEYIDIAPDTHITKCSVRLGVITEEETEKLTKEQISEKWRTALRGSGIDPIDMHAPLWFWSRNGFVYEL